MASFSGAVKIGDLNDFIAPSQACVVNLEGNKISSSDQVEIGTVQLQRPSGFPQVQSSSEGPVKVSLHDCLACSGCVTSAETVLLQHQSIDEFIAKLNDPGTVVVVSLSPQSIVSLAAVYGISPADCVAKITAVLKQQGVAAVFDIAWARDIALLEAAAEFISRYKLKHNITPALANGGASAVPLPMLASACPGWVCYAEKTHGNFVLPYIGTSKSPQAVMGTLLKQQWAASQSILPSSIYLCAVMPCYDKKLEASRDDFSSTSASGTVVPETDCVLATTELHDWLEGLQIDLQNVPAAAMDSPFTNQVSGGHGQSYSVPGGSGGYMEYIFRTAAKELFNQDLPSGPLPLVQGRNADIKEVSLVVNGQRVLHFASAYGFRNIQGLMRKIKSGRCEYDYVEIMACPSGCLNGGGQMKPSQGVTAAQLIEQLEIDYSGAGYLEQRLPQLNDSVQALYRDWIGDLPGSNKARAVFHTQYHKREKTVASAIADW